MDKSMLALLSGIFIPAGVLLALHREASHNKVNIVYKPSPLLRYINVAGIKVEKVPYKYENSKIPGSM